MRTEDRSNSRNGYRDRLWETRAGSIDFRIPKLHVFPDSLKPDGGDSARKCDPPRRWLAKGHSFHLIDVSLTGSPSSRRHCFSIDPPIRYIQAGQGHPTPETIRSLRQILPTAHSLLPQLGVQSAAGHRTRMRWYHYR
jgi:hypothetical protein